jgi:hypothetical protein
MQDYKSAIVELRSDAAEAALQAPYLQYDVRCSQVGGIAAVEFVGGPPFFKAPRLAENDERFPRSPKSPRRRDGDPSSCASCYGKPPGQSLK